MGNVAGYFRTTSRWFALAVGIVLVSGQQVRAATSPSVTLNFTGTYVTTTCNVVGSADQTVTLDTISTQSLNTAGQMADTKVFTIPIQCDSGVTGARVFFESGSMVDGNTGNLINQPVAGQTSATNVEVALQNFDGTPIKVGDRSTMKTISVTSTAPMLTSFIASYYATGATTPGVVNAFVTYVIEIP